MDKNALISLGDRENSFINLAVLKRLIKLLLNKQTSSLPEGLETLVNGKTVNFGDILYSDGTISSTPIEGKQAIAVCLITADMAREITEHESIPWDTNYHRFFRINTEVLTAYNVNSTVGPFSNTEYDTLNLWEPSKYIWNTGDAPSECAYNGLLFTEGLYEYYNDTLIPKETIINLRNLCKTDERFTGFYNNIPVGSSDWYVPSIFEVTIAFGMNPVDLIEYIKNIKNDLFSFDALQTAGIILSSTFSSTSQVYAFNGNLATISIKDSAAIPQCIRIKELIPLLTQINNLLNLNSTTSSGLIITPISEISKTLDGNTHVLRPEFGHYYHDPTTGGAILITETEGGGRDRGNNSLFNDNNPIRIELPKSSNSSTVQEIAFTLVFNEQKPNFGITTTPIELGENSVHLVSNVDLSDLASFTGAYFVSCKYEGMFWIIYFYQLPEIYEVDYFEK